MRKTLSVIAALAVLALWTSRIEAQNLLVNPGIDDPPVHEGATATGWTLQTFKTNSGPSDTANFADFADREAPAGRGLWNRTFLGTTGDPGQAILSQDVAGIPGVKYVMTGWAHFEPNFAGGLDGFPSDTVFALEFLGAGDAVLVGSQSIELRANGQTNDPDTSPAGGGRDWMQHMLMGTAPAGTLEVRVRASAVDMVNNPAGGQQGAFFDDFSLTIIPEPACAMLGLIGILGVLGLARRR